jgi:hypothetical protein
VQTERVLEQYSRCTTNYHQNNWLELLAMAKFAYNNIVHSLTQQTTFFANHGLHPMFNIQGVHNVVNPIVGDQALWFTNVQAQLVFNFEETLKCYKESANEHWKQQPNFKVRD